MVLPGGWNRPFRNPLEAEVVECQAPLHPHRKAGQTPTQAADPTRPVEYGCEFKVIVTNKRTDLRDVVAFHEGRGSQEDILAELKTHCQMDYMPVGTRVGNQPYMFAGILARDLTRELQIQIDGRVRGTTPKRAALRCFREMETLRRTPSGAPDPYSIGRQINPLHEQRRQLGRGTPTCPHGIECCHLIDPSLRQFMQQSDPLHANPGFPDQSGRAVVRRTGAQATAAEHPCLHKAARSGHPRLHRKAQPKPETLQVDEIRRRYPQRRQMLRSPGQSQFYYELLFHMTSSRTQSAQ